MKTRSSIFSIFIILFVLSACASQAAEDQITGEEPALTSTQDLPTVPSATSTKDIDELNSALIPDGLLSIGQNTNVIRLTTLEGQVIDEWQFPGYKNPPITPARSNRFHFGSITEEGVITSPCIFFSTIHGDPRIVFHQDKSPIITLQQIDGLVNLVGAPQQPLVVFSSLDPDNVRMFNATRGQAQTDSSTEPTSVPPVVNSWLYAASLETSPENEALLTKSDEDGYAIYPLAVKMEGKDLIGVWYTLQYQGLFGGGPIIFTGFRGLYYLDQNTDKVEEVLDHGSQTLALSGDQTTAAYKDTSTAEEPAVVIQDFTAGTTKRIVVLPDTNPTGVGDAHFSPSGKYLAWLEFHFEEDIYYIIRITSTIGEELIEIDTRDLKTEITDQEIHTISLAGWLDDGRIVIEAHTSSDSVLYSLDIKDMSLTYLASGHFIGFTYP